MAASGSPPIEPETKKARIERINELSQLARTAWFTLMGYLVFVGITLLGVRDADFFVPSRQTDLPLVNVAIPTASFFWTAPVLGAALYIYLHLFLIKLWDAHGEARTEDADATHHWLVNDFALIRRGDPITRARPLWWLNDWVTRLLVWAAGPFVLAFAWWRSMPAHEEWLTLVIGACLWLSLVVGFTSWWHAENTLGATSPLGWSRFLRGETAVLAGALLALMSWARTEEGIFLARTNLNGVTLPPRFDLAGRDLRRASAAGVSLVGADLHGARLQGTDLSGAHMEDVNLQQAKMDWANLGGTQMDGASLWRAQMTGANLSASRMKNADLRDARLDDANLNGAQLESADLTGAHIEQANLRGARMAGARLWRTSLQDADLREVDFERADLWNSQMQGAVLWWARFRDAHLRDVRLEGSDLSAVDFRGTRFSDKLMGASLAYSADLRGALGLTQAHLDQWIGDVHTLLPEGIAPDTGEPYHIWNCWKAPPIAFEALIDSLGKHYGGPARLRDRVLCGSNARQKLRNGRSLDAPYPNDHPIAKRQPRLTPSAPPAAPDP
ncbi:pentapeptide repeat-containing protein [Amaricoccus sp. W119]|uniref:pentapeptide repeat-containing protein n=1 Tax=Amaricoccus sp. W119 TaxID=3391833 RepID=UPI0039A68E62